MISPNIKSRKYWPFLPWLVFAASLGFTALATHYVWEATEAEDRQEFVTSTIRIASTIKSEMEVYESVLRGAAGFIGASESVSKEEFNTYVGRLLLRSRYPGMQGVGYLEKLNDVETTDTLPMPGTSDRTVGAIDTSATVIRVKFIEPGDRRNLAAIGYNMYTEPIRHAAMNYAADSGLPVLTTRVSLLQEIDQIKQPGVIMFLPVYKNGTVPTTLVNRRKNLEGFIFAPFRTQDLFEAILSQLPPTPVKIKVLDATSSSAVELYSTSGDSKIESEKTPRFIDVQSEVIRGRNWRMEFASPAAFGSSYQKGAVPATAIAGTVFSLLLLGAGLAQVRARQWAEDAVRQLRISEHELQEAGAALEWKVADRTNSLERTISDQALMKEFTDQLQACFSIDEASGAIKHFSAKLFPGWSGCVSLLNSSKNHLEVISYWGTEKGGQSLFSPDECWALRRGRPHHVEDGKSGLACPHFEDFTANELLCVPMLAQGDTVGVLHLYRRPGDRRMAGELQLATSVAEHVGLVLANIKLREILRAQSVRDPLTNLFNRRYMEESIERELARCVRNGSPLSVMMMDLDHFKRFNDLYGHEVGDEILRGLSQIIQSSVRSEDIACRYGGEEFIIILPDSDLENTLRRAENIRAKVAEAVITHRNKDYDNLTISIGVAGYPIHSDNANVLVRKADMALYQAKAQGRNRVVGFEENFLE